MKKIYISGPITGHDDYMRRFGAAEDLLREQGCIVYNPAAVNQMMPPETDYEEYMAIAMTMLSFCDAIYMLRGWQESLGANREYGYALAKHLNIRFEED
ncbi:MAG: DUF4406 domain-containing protein [Butyrivibrio sp.]|nr:DUF4406 domain-containing protein [Butyrivibrio sp.]